MTKKAAISRPQLTTKAVSRLQGLCRSLAKAEAGTPGRDRRITWTDVDRLLDLGWIYHVGSGLSFKLTAAGRAQ